MAHSSARMALAAVAALSALDSYGYMNYSESHVGRKYQPGFRGSMNKNSLRKTRRKAKNGKR